MSRTNKHISAQIIDDVNGRTLAAASSVEVSLRETTGGNIEGAKAVAELLVTRAKEANIATWSLTVVASTTTAEWRRSPTLFVPVDWSFNELK